MFEITAPTHRRQLLGVAIEAARALDLPARDLAHLARMMFQVFTLTEFELLRWDRRTLDEFIRQHTEHPGAYFLFSFLASIFFVLPPWQVSAGESIRCLRAILRDYSLSYVEGGMDSLTHAFLLPVPMAGGDVVVGQQVVSIRPWGGSVVVTTFDGTEYAAPQVACNVEPWDLLQMLEVLEVPADYASRVAAIKPSGNAHQVKLALRRPLVDEGCIIGGVSSRGLGVEDLTIDLMHRTVEDIDTGRVSDPLAVYAPVPTNYDPSLGPDGAQLIVASIYGPVRADPCDPAEVWRSTAMAALEQILPGMHNELLFAEFTPIPQVGMWMGKSSCGAICNGQFPGQVGPDRLPVETPFEGVYLCGDGAGGRGSGTELAAAASMQSARAMLAARPRVQRTRAAA
jgi:prolycopene isomerase